MQFVTEIDKVLDSLVYKAIYANCNSGALGASLRQVVMVQNGMGGDLFLPRYEHSGFFDALKWMAEMDET